MGTTYATSAECGAEAGMKTVSANTYPTTTMIDGWRDTAYAKIGKIIGHGTTDSNGVAKTVEKQMVARKIEAIQNRQIYSIIMLPEEFTLLVQEFEENMGIGKWQPDQDSSISG